MLWVLEASRTPLTRGGAMATEDELIGLSLIGAGIVSERHGHRQRK